MYIIIYIYITHETLPFSGYLPDVCRWSVGNGASLERLPTGIPQKRCTFWHGEMDGSSRPHSSSWQDFNMRRKSGINQIFCPWAMITPNRKLLYTCNYLEATNITASALSPHCVRGDTTCRDCQRCAISGSWHSQLCLVPPMKHMKEGGSRGGSASLDFWFTLDVG